MSTKAKLAWGWIAALGILHYDFWFWDDPTIVFGFLPIGLLWQMGISLGAALGWFLLVQWGWPERAEEWAAESDDGAGGEG